jgi:hypothetical protein
MMKKLVKEVMEKIEENPQWIEELKQCENVKERLRKLMEILPEIWLLSGILSDQVLYQIYKKYQIDFGVCPFYEIEGEKSYCTIEGEKIESTCHIPEVYCVFRDKDGKPKYPELQEPWEDVDL